jgi:hypothetical protein
MKLASHALALFVGLALVAPAFAQADPAKEEPPKKEETAKEDTAKPDEAAKPEAAKDEAAKAEDPKAEAAAAAPAASPAPEASPAPAAAAAAAHAKEPTPAPTAVPVHVAEPPKELSACAKSFVPLADTYATAYDDMKKWIGEIDTKTAATSENAQKMQTQIQENEAAITKAKFDRDNAKAKELQKENKTLWDSFNAAKKEASAQCSQYSKDAAARVKQYADATAKALETMKAQAK